MAKRSHCHGDKNNAYSATFGAVWYPSRILSKLHSAFRPPHCSLNPITRVYPVSRFTKCNGVANTHTTLRKEICRPTNRPHLYDACTTTSAYRCAKDISSQRGRFCATSLASCIPRSAKTGYHECSSKLCAAAPVVASDSLDDVG